MGPTPAWDICRFSLRENKTFRGAKGDDGLTSVHLNHGENRSSLIAKSQNPNSQRTTVMNPIKTSVKAINSTAAIGKM